MKTHEAFLHYSLFGNAGDYKQGYPICIPKVYYKYVSKYVQVGLCTGSTSYVVRMRRLKHRVQKNIAYLPTQYMDGWELEVWIYAVWGFKLHVKRWRVFIPRKWLKQIQMKVTVKSFVRYLLFLKNDIYICWWWTCASVFYSMTFIPSAIKKCYWSKLECQTDQLRPFLMFILDLFLTYGLDVNLNELEIGKLYFT